MQRKKFRVRFKGLSARMAFGAIQQVADKLINLARTAISAVGHPKVTAPIGRGRRGDVQPASV